eukprot:3505539-Amphidinium_carterae.1
MLEFRFGEMFFVYDFHWVLFVLLSGLGLSQEERVVANASTANNAKSSRALSQNLDHTHQWVAKVVKAEV